ncbi:MAG: hypothetical protein AAF822_15265 [Pseudomonadota bacterium]
MQRRDFLTYSAGMAAGMLAHVSTAAPAAAQAANLPLTMPQEHRFARSNWIPNPPLRAKTGDGKIITGRVIAFETGEAVPNAEVEFWLNTTLNAGGIGEQNPDNRGYVVADAEGRFAFETLPPQRVSPSAPPHTHTRVTGSGREPFFYRHVTTDQPSTDEITVILRNA